MKTKIFAIAALFFALASCGKKQAHLPQERQPKDHTKENLLAMNIALAQNEDAEIDRFLRKNAELMQKSAGGFWYNIAQTGEGDSIRRGDRVRVAYNLRLLDGTTLYTPSDGGEKTLTVGRADETKGLDEALLMLREGASGTFLIPANLAYGTIGDQQRVGSKKTVIYEIQTVEKLR